MYRVFIRMYSYIAEMQSLINRYKHMNHTLPLHTLQSALLDRIFASLLTVCELYKREQIICCNSPNQFWCYISQGFIIFTRLNNNMNTTVLYNFHVWFEDIFLKKQKQRQIQFNLFTSCFSVEVLNIVCVQKKNRTACANIKP